MVLVLPNVVLWLVQETRAILSTNQMQKLKYNRDWVAAFSRAPSSLLVFILSSHCLMIIWIFILIGRLDNSGFGFLKHNWKLLLLLFYERN